MEYTNSEKLTAVLVKWAKPMVDEIVASRLGNYQPIVAANEWVKKYFPVASNYSIVNDLSFLVVPSTEIVVGNFVRNGIAKLGVADADSPGYASKLLAAMMEQAEKEGKISLFGSIELEKSDLEKLRTMLERNLPVEVAERYEVKE